ncbi:Uncharacterised protein [Bordetella pertussis]|nr:Uncharacterised protein [Bordetella pertussis]CFW46291.1 Uncharacterised protein [Bordetella pertussis]
MPALARPSVTAMATMPAAVQRIECRAQPAARRCSSPSTRMTSQHAPSSAYAAMTHSPTKKANQP